MRRIPTLVIAVVLGPALIAAACSSDDPASGPAPAGPGSELVIELHGEDFALASSLSGFAGCSELLDHLRSAGAARVGPYGLDQGFFGGGPWPVDVALAEEDTVNATASPDAVGGEIASAPQAADLTEGVDFSGTNVQEVGVDEADIVKTDGARVLIVARGQLVVVDVATRSVIGTLEVDVRDQTELYLTGDDVLLVTFGWGYGIPEPIPLGAPTVEADFAPAPVGGPTTVITRITLTDGDPVRLESLTVDGEHVAGRAVDGTARIVVRSNPQYDFPFVYPAGPSGEQRAEEANREALLDSELDDWLPGFTTTDGDGNVTAEGLLTPCEQVHAPTEFAGFGVLSVLTLPVDGTLDPSTTSSVLAPGTVVYGSPDSIYVATTAWIDPTALDEADWQQIQTNRRTSIHRFDITSPTSAAYRASGSVPGDVRDRFSLSEYDGHLRVVTTSGDPWSAASETWLRVLREEGDELVEVGAVGDMGRGEAVQSVRFQGEVGYVVTFRTVDPLYTLDLSDPEHPTVRGELKIPGFSSYLHPIGDGLVLGVGSDADETTGRVRGSKISLFDVSDLDAPREISTWLGPDGWNNVGWDPHAFLWWAPERLAVVPVESWVDGQQWAGAVVLRVDDGAITELGRIDHTDPGGTRGDSQCRSIGAADLPSSDESDFRSELEFMVADGSTLVLDCGPNDRAGADGFVCEQQPWIADEADALGIRVDGELYLCWNDGPAVAAITRSIVLGEELWTIGGESGRLDGHGGARLQVNALDTLDRLDTIIV